MCIWNILDNDTILKLDNIDFSRKERNVDQYFT